MSIEMKNTYLGDLLLVKSGIIAHQVNTKVMGAGLALHIKTKWPKVEQQFLEMRDEMGWKLGDLQMVQVSNAPLFVANCCGQIHTGPGDNTDYNGVANYLAMLAYLSNTKGLIAWIPERLGSGLAGGSKDRMFAAIDGIFSSTTGSEYRMVRYAANMVPVEVAW
jgi:O-acetyl-ADP-ribose deacetylase (regulator of RNase III)